MIKKTILEYTHGDKNSFIKDSLKMIWEMELGKWSGKTELYI